ncbi:MAG: ROK family protein [Gammaproteobacteria bacterium]|nr:ROK family protein [Gammaproteobacteria bacterium]
MPQTTTYRLGIDLGGTKIEGIALDTKGRDLARYRIPTPQNDYTGTLAAICDIVKTLKKDTSSEATIGIGTPGSISPVTGHLRNSNSVCLNGQPLREDLEARLGAPIRIANDANCFALSEAIDGAAQAGRVVFGAILGTGCGGGLVVNKALIIGANGIGGEWGHNPLPWPNEDELDGRPCFCGQCGCLETWISGTGLAADHLAVTSQHLTAKAIVASASQEPTCEASVARYEDRLARALAQVINLVDPDIIVLGGGLSNVTRLYKNIPKRWGRYIFSDVVKTRLCPPRYGDASGVRGAAWLWN